MADKQTPLTPVNEWIMLTMKLPKDISNKIYSNTEWRTQCRKKSVKTQSED
jgi:hypothetical protein